MINFLSETFKGNDSYEKRGSLLVYCRVAKENMFTGFNNAGIYDLFNPKFRQYFGFLQSEVDQLLNSKKVKSH